MSYIDKVLSKAAERYPVASAYIQHLDDLRHVLEPSEVAAWMQFNKPCLHSEIWSAHVYILEALNMCGTCDGSGSVSTHMVCDPRSEDFTCDECNGTGQLMDHDEAFDIYTGGVYELGDNWLESAE